MIKGFLLQLRLSDKGFLRRPSETTKENINHNSASMSVLDFILSLHEVLGAWKTGLR